VELNGQPIKTPAKRTLILPGCALAEAIAREWETHKETLSNFTFSGLLGWRIAQQKLVVNEVVE